MEEAQPAREPQPPSAEAVGQAGCETYEPYAEGAPEVLGVTALEREVETPALKEGKAGENVWARRLRWSRSRGL